MKKHRLAIFSGAGDSTVVEWEVEDAKQVALAQGVFDKAVEEGWAAVTPTSEGATAMETFDPRVEEVFLLRPIGGGA